jgi:hypothetical protein
MIPSGIDPETFRFVQQCLNHCAMSRAKRTQHWLGRPAVKNILEAEIRALPIGLVVVTREIPLPTEIKNKLLNSSERIDA